MNKIIKICILIIAFMFIGCLDNKKTTLEKSKSILYNGDINIDEIMNKMQAKTFKNDSLTKNYLSKKLTEISTDTIIEIGQDTLSVARFIAHEYGDIFKNGHKYLIVYEQSMMRTGYNWFLQTNKGFVKFYERDKDGIEGALYVKDSIFDTNKDGIYELVAYKRRGGSGSDYKIIYFIGKDGFISKEVVVDKLNEEELKTIDKY